jgi:hypothetical protein
VYDPAGGGARGNGWLKPGHDGAFDVTASYPGRSATEAEGAVTVALLPQMNLDRPASASEILRAGTAVAPSTVNNDSSGADRLRDQATFEYGRWVSGAAGAIDHLPRGTEQPEKRPADVGKRIAGRTACRRAPASGGVRAAQRAVR